MASAQGLPASNFLLLFLFTYILYNNFLKKSNYFVGFFSFS